MYSIVLLFLVFQFGLSYSSDIPSVADLQDSPGTVGNILDSAQTNIPSGSFGIGPLTNIGPGAVENIGQNRRGNIGNIPDGLQIPTDPKSLGQTGGLNIPSLQQGLGQTGGLNIPSLPQGLGLGAIGNVPSGIQQTLGQAGVGNIPGVPQIPSENLPNGLQIPGLGQGGIGNLSNLLNGTQGNLGLTTVIEGDETDLVRPCQVFDIFCIRRYFRKNGKCKEVRVPVPDPFYRAQSLMQLPRINVSVTAFDVLYSGLNGRIVEFYLDRQTDRLVLAIEFRNVTFFSKDVFYRIFRQNREPINTFDYLYFNFQSLITTTIIPKIRNIQLDRSKTYVYLNDAIPSLSIGPNAFNYPDPSVEKARSEILPRISQIALEALLTEGPFFATTFIQYNICDFHLQVL